MAKLYQLKAQYEDALNALIASADEETGEVDLDIAAMLDKIEGELVEKAQSTAAIYKTLNNNSAIIDGEIKRLQALKKRYDNAAGNVKDYLAYSLLNGNTERIDGIIATISFRKSEEIVIDDADILPRDCVRVKTETAPDKVAIKKAIKAGTDIPGAHLETKQNIQIK